MILPVETDTIRSEIEVRNSHSEFNLLCYSFLLTYLLCLKGKRSSVPVEQIRFCKYEKNRKENYAKCYISPTVHEHSTKPKICSCVKCAIMSQIKKIFISQTVVSLSQSQLYNFIRKDKAGQRRANFFQYPLHQGLVHRLRRAQILIKDADSGIKINYSIVPPFITSYSTSLSQSEVTQSLELEFSGFPTQANIAGFEQVDVLTAHIAYC